jgi:amino acid transporter/nucleotide-binding universal stress UspA family protein
MSHKNPATLARTLGYFDATMIGVGAMIGAGVFVLTGIAVGEAGPAAVLAFALNGVVTLFTAFSYAELASTIPEAGGGYAFVKRAFPGLLGFISGWMLWFAYTVACSLYAVGFGGYFVELLHSYFPAVYEFLTGLLGHGGVVGIATLGISGFFISLNVIGSDVTGKAENIITVSKIAVLGVFILFGLLEITGNPELLDANFVPFFPKGYGGVLVAMGLTFIAFEGYDLIATVSEEIRDPKRSIPKATFTSLGIAVTIYLLIIFVSIGAVNVSCFSEIFGRHPLDLAVPDAQVLDPTDPTVNTVWEVLGLYKETGIVRAAENFMPSVGVLIIVFGGLLSTMSALNATVMASSRVAFSMGRERMLPESLAIIHPLRRTPHVAVLVTGAILVALALVLPIATVGSAASVLFLLSFALVNASLILIRRREPDLPRAYRVPLFPWLPALGVITNLSLVVFQFTFQPAAIVASLVWIAAGVIIFFAYTRYQVAPEEPAPILMEETLEARGYSVLVPVKNHAQARLLGILGSVIARERDGEVLALHVVQVPSQLSLTEGRHYLVEGRALMETVISEARRHDVPVHTMLRVGRHVSQVIQMTAEERDVDLMLLGWPGYTHATDVAYGRVIDLLGSNPPCDMAVIRFREREPPQRILVCTIGGPHASLALELAEVQARRFADRHGRPAVITLFSVVSPEKGVQGLEERHDLLQDLVEAHDIRAELKVVAEADVYQAIMAEAQRHNLVMVNAPREGLLEQRLFGSIPERLARECPKTVIMVKRYQPVKSRLARWLRRSQNSETVSARSAQSAEALTATESS